MKWFHKHRVMVSFSGIGVAAAAVFLCWLLKIRTPSNESVPPPSSDQSVILPTIDQIEKITATIYDSKGALGTDPIPAFDIAPEDYPIVLGALTPNQRDDFPDHWKNLRVGQVVITDKDNDSQAIEFYVAGNNKLHFCFDGVRCKRRGEFKPVVVGKYLNMYIDESMVFHNILKGLHEKARSGKISDELSEAVLMLKRSKGLEPPFKSEVYFSLQLILAGSVLVFVQLWKRYGETKSLSAKGSLSLNRQDANTVLFQRHRVYSIKVQMFLKN